MTDLTSVAKDALADAFKNPKPLIELIAQLAQIAAQAAAARVLGHEEQARAIEAEHVAALQAWLEEWNGLPTVLAANDAAADRILASPPASSK